MTAVAPSPATEASVDLSSAPRPRHLLEAIERCASRPWASYLAVFLVQLKVVWGAWIHRDLTGGDTSAWYFYAERWLHEGKLDVIWSPLYTAFYGSLIDLTPGDAYLLSVAHDPEADSSPYMPYSSSYYFPACFFSPDAETTASSTVSQGGNHNTYQVEDDVPLGGRRVSEVTFPSLKMQMVERVQRQAGALDVSFYFVDARVPNLFVDGSAHMRAGADANRGFDPENPTGPFPTFFTYMPNPPIDPH